MNERRPFSFFQAARQGSNQFWLYVAGLVLVLAGNFLGSIPFSIIALAAARRGDVNAQDLASGKIDFEGMGLHPAVGLILIIIPFITWLAALWVVVRFIHRRPFLTLVNIWQRIDWRRVGFAALIWLALTLGMEALFYLVEPENYTFQFDAGQFVPVFFVAIFLLPLQTSAEEWMFRGYLLQGIGLGTGRAWAGILITGLIFGGMHAFNPEISEFGPVFLLSYVGVGILLGITTVMDEGTEIALGLHAINNIYGTVMVTFSSSVLQTPALFSIQEYKVNAYSLAWLVAASLYVWIMARKYQWRDWGKLWKPIQIEPEG